MESPGEVSRGQQAALLGSAAVVTAVAWIWLARMAAAGCPVHAAMLLPQHLSSFVALVVMWQAMMVAMMTPSALGWLIAFARLAEKPHATAAFAAGYFVVWLGYSVAGAALQTAFEELGWMPRNGQIPSRAAGVVLIAAGLIYFLPASRACLTHCRNPLSYFLERWPRGGFGLGLAHGAYCLGCCWALMATGFAMGVMNLAWMAVLTLLIAVEKLAPRGDRIGAAASIAFVIWGVALLIR